MHSSQNILGIKAFLEVFFKMGFVRHMELKAKLNQQLLGPHKMEHPPGMGGCVCLEPIPAGHPQPWSQHREPQVFYSKE